MNESSFRKMKLDLEVVAEKEMQVSHVAMAFA